MARANCAVVFMAVRSLLCTTPYGLPLPMARPTSRSLEQGKTRAIGSLVAIRGHSSLPACLPPLSNSPRGGTSCVHRSRWLPHLPSHGSAWMLHPMGRHCPPLGPSVSRRLARGRCLAAGPASSVAPRLAVSSIHAGRARGTLSSVVLGVGNCRGGSARMGRIGAMGSGAGTLGAGYLSARRSPST